MPVLPHPRMQNPRTGMAQGHPEDGFAEEIERQERFLAEPESHQVAEERHAVAGEAPPIRRRAAMGAPPLESPEKIPASRRTGGFEIQSRALSRRRTGLRRFAASGSRCPVGKGGRSSAHGSPHPTPEVRQGTPEIRRCSEFSDSCCFFGAPSCRQVIENPHPSHPESPRRGPCAGSRCASSFHGGECGIFVTTSPCTAASNPAPRAGGGPARWRSRCPADIPRIRPGGIHEVFAH